MAQAEAEEVLAVQAYGMAPVGIHPARQMAALAKRGLLMALCVPEEAGVRALLPACLPLLRMAPPQGVAARGHQQARLVVARQTREEAGAEVAPFLDLEGLG